MKALGYLLLIVFMFSIGHAGYSIYEIIDYLQENQQYEIINSIKCFLGNDVAIGYCKQLVETEHCDVVVKVYMTKCNSSSGPRRAQRRIPTVDDLSLEARIIYDKLNLDNVDDVKRQLIIIILSFYDILIQNMTDSEIYDFINTKILKRKCIPLSELEVEFIELKRKRLEELERLEKIERLEEIEKGEKVKEIEKLEN